MHAHKPHGFISRRATLTLMFGALLMALSALASGSFVVASGEEPTKGRIPDAAFLEDGGIDVNRVPNFVAVWGADGISIGGYVEKAYLFLADGPVPVGHDEQPIPVVGSDLRTVVGHLVNDKGFVPVGVDPDKIPSVEAVTRP